MGARPSGYEKVLTSDISETIIKKKSVRVAAGPPSEVLPSGVSEDEWNAHVAAGKAMDILTMRDKGICQVKSGSVYAAAFVVPQYARTSGWALDYTALAVRSYVLLVTNILLQCFLLYMISKEGRINVKFSGQMHLCNFGAGLPDCPENSDCKGPRGTAYTPARLYDWNTWANRIFVKDAFMALFPDRMGDINEYVDPGEYGLASYWLRFACCFLFFLGLGPTIKRTVDMLRLLWNVPTLAESWIQYEVPDRREKNATVTFKVAGMPLHWKVLTLLFVVIPHGYIWILMMDTGTLFLMETAGIEDMILHAVAILFVISVDELICTGLQSDTCKHMLESLEPLALLEPVNVDSEKQIWERHQLQRNWSLLSWELYPMMIPSQLVFMIGVTAFFQFKYYVEHCDRSQDGSFVGKTLRLPVEDRMSVVSFLFSPFFPVEVRDDVVWAMPGSDPPG
jgi:hypothetical protein